MKGRREIATRRGAGIKHQEKWRRGGDQIAALQAVDASAADGGKGEIDECEDEDPTAARRRLRGGVFAGR